MSHVDRTEGVDTTDTAPGDEPRDGHEPVEGISGYLIGLGLATLLTIVSFFSLRCTDLVWEPSIPVALAVLAIAQMGVHLVSFSTSRPDRTTSTTSWRWPSAC